MSRFEHRVLAVTPHPVVESGVREFGYGRADFDRVAKLIHCRAGIVLSQAKQDMVYSRLVRRVRALGMAQFRDYLDHLERLDTDDPELEAFTNALTTNLTSFFREPHHFEVLRDYLATLPAGRPPRIWCAAASTGEEPYSIAMTVAEHFGRVDAPCEIVASDIDTQVLEQGRRGVYPIDRITALDQGLVKRWFRRGIGAMDGYCKVIEPLARMIDFRQLNLLDSDWPLRGPFDVIFCRNVMIYFNKPTQLQILQKLVPLMAPDGLFIAGHSESYLHAAELIRSCGRTVYRRAQCHGATV